jgi:shikimate kinase
MRALPNKIILIGFMGTGKSTIARALAAQLGFSVMELDTLIVERSGRASIPEIFAHEGEVHFRDLESDVCAATRLMRSIVVSTGGGVIGRELNLEHLTAEGGLVIFLKTSFEEIVARNIDIEDRPLFRNREQARELFERRAPTYVQWADIVIDTDRKSVEEICSELLSSIQSRP